MTAIKSERFGSDWMSANKPVAEKPERPGDDKLSDLERTAAVEGEIREFVRRDVSLLRRAQPPAGDAPDLVPETGAEPVTENLNSLIQRVSSTSMEEIDRVILELQAVRDMLRKEGDRVVREISGYSSLSHAATTSMKVIAESLAQWRNAPLNHPPRPMR
jgi:hypothetical protein